MNPQQSLNIRTLPELGVQVVHAADIPEVIGATFGLDGLLLRDADLGPDFLNLKTGLLGELFQKFVNYRLPVALVVTDPDRYGPRFTELAREHARHPLIRFVPDEAAGRAWLHRQTAPHPTHPQ
ncbi:DUF4180 domain-containing protein [Deinococcus radiotolerans]|uniref:DUF4180 domain-containing protein n=1 Tax=Deinococcus radiotolerans TaxID=1309407 RepID=A0ABQ2FE86_9DEIO|nr:DUF4180 domain-containing protein [Deinococcus radiotolerans]GGK87446.1 hypothetical protein GCM10010844_02480 [Deinococcus radiotolerans]